jgi:hypothetical protein
LSDRQTLRFVEARNCALLTGPAARGSPEVVELQVLLMIEVGPPASDAPDEGVEGLQDRYTRHLAPEVGGPTASLALRLGLQLCQSEYLPRDGSRLAQNTQLSR